ncbi:oxidoreductase [Candidatus Atribacteria bacterium HGW-Atribacteria-1]|nr:MAG: oxidoreductase [Candidatus Atribacteria bacterium HGW-Atribacteria-1]
MDNSIRVGFIGAGEFSVFHANAIKQSCGGRLVGLWNRTKERRYKRAKEYGCRVFPSPEELVNNPEIDAVFVLTNLETHPKYVKMALNAGKNVFVEKPVALKSEDLIEIDDLAKEKALICMPGHNMIYEDGINRIKNMVDTKKIGRVVSIYVIYNMFHPEELASRYPGVIRQIFTHNLYTLLYLGGIPEKVSAFKETLHYKEYDKEDLALANIKMQSGALGHIAASFAADDSSSDPWTFLIKVIGTEGSARYTYQDWVEASRDAYHTHTYIAYQGSVNNEVQHFINICQFGGDPLSTINDAFIAQRTLEAIEASIEKEQVVYIDLGTVKNNMKKYEK